MYSYMPTPIFFKKIDPLTLKPLLIYHVIIVPRKLRLPNLNVAVVGVKNTLIFKILNALIKMLAD